ncbi:MAG: NAD(P)H-binding protein [Sphingomonadaceae bacterium]|nr:NAD(P)H-binding protein [Sphingomonadaceae bacterium]
MGREAVQQIVARPDRPHLRVLIRPEERAHPVVRDIIARDLAEIAWGDLIDRQSVAAAVKGCDVVLHVGGLVSPLADNLPPDLVTSVNVGGARNIVDAIVDQGQAGTTRLVYIGTVAQTGDRNPPIHWGRTGDPIKVSTFDHYAITKTMAEAVIAESGIRQWVSLRQSGMAHFRMWQINDPIMFHNPFNGVFEWSTAADSGRLMAGFCADQLPDALWGNFFNIGGGEANRVTNHDFMRRQMPNYEKVLRPHWFATHNFHGQWYSDSDRLEELVPFRGQPLSEFIEDYKRQLPAPVRLVPKVAPWLVKRQLEKMAKGPGGTLNWFATNDEEHIRAYFGSRGEWEAIPRDWEGFEFSAPSRQPRLLDHGYDETKPRDTWSGADLQLAAHYRGGKCHAGDGCAPFEPVGWECCNGHSFTMSPNLMLKGGHWCPTCMLDPAWYAPAASRSPFFAQVWQQ